jgi:site-specific DNA-methyltransferase (adenine-specific)
MEKRPDRLYFEELIRVSKNQIIWGGNYFTDMLYPNRFWVCWQKGNPAPNFSDFELAWGSFDKVAVTAKLDSYGFRHADKINDNGPTIHPTQKPIVLYKWLAENYANPGDIILDTHVGSASSLIAYESLGFNYVGYELDPDYYAAAKNRMSKGIQKDIFSQ